MCELQKECGGQGSLPSDARRTDSGSVVLGQGHLATSAPARRSGETMSVIPPSRVRGENPTVEQFSCTSRSTGCLFCSLLRVNATEVPQSGNKGAGCASPPAGPEITRAVVSQLWHVGFNPGPFVNSHTDLVQKGI